MHILYLATQYTNRPAVTQSDRTLTLTHPLATFLVPSAGVTLDTGVTLDKFKIPNAMSRVKEFHDENIYLQSFII